ncbi:MAG: glycosyltransferase family 39 protein [Candidatus Omnitrophica bacterium]|nr:glycosyltransferase family 39 protein [Candidatus Omnitrophota bacterium]
MNEKASLPLLLRYPYFLILLINVAVYASTLGNAFMLDDYVVLFNELGISNKSFFAIFHDYQHIFSRPVGHLVMWLSYPIFKTDPVPYHVLNILLFSVICFLFYKIVEKLFHNRELAVLTAVLYALHPVNSMLVNYVTVTVITTFVICLQASFLFLLKYLDSQKRSHLAWSLGFFFLGLLSHEMSMVYPAYVFCLLYFLRGFSWRKALIFILPYLAMSAVYLLYRMFFFSLKGQASAVFAVLHLFDVYISSIMALIYWYLGKLFFPQGIVFLWSAVIEEHYNPIEVYRFLLIVLVILYLIFVRWKKGLKAFALSVFVIGLLPVFISSYAHFPFAEPMIEPHWFYFSSIGFFLIVARGLLWLKDTMTFRLWAVLVGVWLGAYIVLLQNNNSHWLTQERYCKYWIAKNPANTTPFYGLGQVALARKDTVQAVAYLEKTLKMSRYHSAFITADLGYAYVLSGETDKAVEMFKVALETDPKYSVTFYYIALLKWQQGDKKGAESFLLKAQELYAKSNVYSRELSRLKSGRPPEMIYPLLHLGGS